MDANLSKMATNSGFRCWENVVRQCQGQFCRGILGFDKTVGLDKHERSLFKLVCTVEKCKFKTHDILKGLGNLLS